MPLKPQSLGFGPQTNTGLGVVRIRRVMGAWVGVEACHGLEQLAMAAKRFTME